MRQKISSFRLVVVVRQIQHTTTSNELPSVEEEKQLKDLFKVKVPIDVIAGKLSRKPDAVIIKCKRLKLEVVVAKGYTSTAIKFILHYVLVELEVVGVEKKITPTTTSNLTLPEESYAPKN